MGYTPNEWHPLDVITSEKLNELEKGLTKTSEDVVYGSGGAQQSSDGIHSLTYIDKGDALPNNPQVGDTIFMKDGDDFSILEWDGEQWSIRVDPKLSDRIQTALDEAKDNTQTLINNNNESINEMMDQVTKDKIDLALKDADFNAKAQAMADKALSDAKANTTTVAQETLDSANQNLSAAKSDLTNSIASEASARNAAVAAANSQAQTYANQAKADAMSAASSADGVIRTTISSSANSLSTTITQNKSSADSGISTAQTTAQQAVDGLKTKVSQTDYNAKTGQLQTDLTATTQTANQAKTDIVSIKQTDTSQDARMTQIESDTSGVKTTVSNLQTTQGKQSGDISTLQQRADGFEGSIRDINNFVNNLGQVNQLINTEFSPDLQGWYASPNLNSQSYPRTNTLLVKSNLSYNGSNAVMIDYSGQTADYAGYTKMYPDIVNVYGHSVVSWRMAAYVEQVSSNSATYFNATIDFFDKDMTFISNTGGNMFNKSKTGVWQNSSDNNSNFLNVSVPTNAYYAGFKFYPKGQFKIHLSRSMVVFDSPTVGAYVQGNYNNNGVVAQVKLTADKASLDLSKYQTDADGRISKAQADIITNANAITQKVSQTDYDKKTGDLTTAVSKAQTTADGAVTTVGNYQTSNDNRVSSAETKISQNASDITLRATTADLNAAKSDYNAQIAQVKVDASKVETTVSNLSDTVNNISIGGRNYVLNSSGLNATSTTKPTLIGAVSSNVRSTLSYGSDGITLTNSTGNTGSEWYYQIAQSWQDITQTPLSDGNYMVSVDVMGTASQAILRYGQKSSQSSDLFQAFDINNTTWTRISMPIVFAPNTTTFYIRINGGANGAISGTGIFTGTETLKFRNVKIESGNKATDWTPAPEDTVNALASQQVTIDGLTDTASKQGANIDSVTKRVQTAEGTLSTATDNISGLQTKQTTTANQVTQEIADRKTGDTNTLQSSKDFTTSSITGYDTGLQTQLTQTNSGILATVSANNLVVDSSLMDSALSNSIVNWDQSGANKFYYASGVAYQGVQSIGYNQTTLNGDYSYLHSQTWSNYSFAGSTLNVSVDIRANQMGGTATDNLVISLVECDTKMAVIAQTTIASITTANSSWVNYRKKITVNGASKNLYLSYAMQGNGNVYIARPYVGVQELVTGGYTAGFNNNNQTILSLFKDNWSIGINDNIGGIVSGIVGSASQMSLISKKVVIDSPSTQITGTAWINSAMIQNGSIVNANIADATITNAKIATLDVAKITGDISNFIQSNWNGTYGSTTITSSGMQITTANSHSVFDADGMSVFSALGDSTNFKNGGVSYITSSNENIGMMGTAKWSAHPNVDYLMIGLNGWHTTTPGDDDYDSISGKNNTVYGGDSIIFGISNANNDYDALMTWDSSLVAGYKGRMSGWHVEDTMTWNQAGYFKNGLTISNSYGSSDNRSLHIQGATLSNKNKWYGFFDADSQAGFGTDNSHDVLFYVKGRAYSLYTMLNKLGML